MMWFFRPKTAKQRRLVAALWIIFGLFAVTLAISRFFNAPDWLNSLIIVGYPVTWLVAATVIKIRYRD